MRKELEINHICKEDESKVVKKPSVLYMSDGQKSTHDGKGTKLYQDLLEQKLQAARERDTNSINPGVLVKILCSLELEQKK